MAKTAPLGVRLDPAVKAGLEQAAATNMRSLSNTVEVILTDWLRQNGYLPKPAMELEIRQPPLAA
ncbi:hypothetical protein [Belnapia moabensis]|uniref:hypothetical protein n=1 Tax=Belnapia moabensis TaxID=365533 RepID=UPI0005BC8AC9|nr:hypothetical protein [Belnapia moabensis]